MFRTLRAQGRVLTTGRLPLRVQAQAHHDPSLNIQKVRFHRPFRPRRLVTSILTVALGYALFVNIVFAPLDRLNQELDQESSKLGNTEEDENEEDAAVFLPFPGTIKQVNPKPYKGTDPEWMEFVKFSKNNELNKRVRDDLAQYVLSICEKNTAISHQVGKDIKLRRYWLDVDYPHSPPPEFERSGIEISDNHISWTTMPVDSLTVFRLKSILWPSAVTQSFWTFWKVLLVQDSKKITDVFSTEPNKPSAPKSFEEIHKALQMRAKNMEESESMSKDNSPSPTARSVHGYSETPKEPNPSGPSNPLENASEDQSKGFEKTPNKSHIGRVDSANSTPDLMTVKIHILRALLAFQSKFAQTWKQVPNYPPRGSLYVSGLVELDSSKAWVVVDVKAAWDPKTRTFDDRSMILQIRRLQYKRQPPRGSY